MEKKLLFVTSLFLHWQNFEWIIPHALIRSEEPIDGQDFPIPTGIRGKMIENQQVYHQEQQPFYDLSTLVYNLLRSPVPLSHAIADSREMRLRAELRQITPSGFASLMLGISLALMLCGSVTFFIGFLLMPWVLGLVIVLYIAGVVSAISTLGRALVCFVMGPPCPRKDVSGNCAFELNHSGVEHG